MLTLKNFISKGAKRICFEHPHDANKIVKITASYKDVYLLERELKTYSRIKEHLAKYLPVYEPKLVDTNLGKSLVCELLRDDNGEYSKSLDRYRKKPIDEELKTQLLDFCRICKDHNIFFYDFNWQNFLVQIKDGHKKLYYIDLKSYNHYKPWTFLRLEKVFPPLARHLMSRRMQRLLQRLDI